MLLDEPTLRTPIILALLAALAFIGSDRAAAGPKDQEWLTALLAIAGLIFAVFAFITGLDYIMSQFGQRLLTIRRALTINERTEIMRLARELTTEQIELVLATAGPIEFEIEPGLIRTLYIRGTNVTMEFAAEFMNRSTDTRLAPIRTWSEGSRDRTMAVEFTTLLINRGYAKPAAGNRPGIWTIPKDRVAAWYLAGMESNDENTINYVE